MNKTTIIAIVLVAIFGVGGYLLFSNSGNNGSDNPENNTSTMSSDSGVKCVQKVNNMNGNSLETTIYFYKNKMRYDGVLGVTANGQKDVHMISDGNGNQYMWGQSVLGSLGGGKGLKMKVGSEQDYGPSIDVEELKKHDFKAPGVTCTAWNPDTSLFELPKDIEFVDMDNMMPTMQPNITGQGAVGNMCAMCDSIPNEQAKQECKKSCEESQ